jgi:arylsulfatase A-like enzyme
MRHVSRLIVLTIAFGVLSVCADQVARGVESPSIRPNIIVVLVDDMGWGDFSCFGNKEVETPNIDRLAAEGLRFEQFYVNAPICSPSRVAISTGQYPTRWRITSFLNNRKENERRGIAQWLDPKAPMLARMLQTAGYATGHFGKWHMGGQRDVGDAPLITEYGFDESLTNFEGLGPRILPLLDAYDGKPAQKHALGSDTLGHGAIHWEQRDKITAAYTAAAIKFIDEAESKSQPFYINLWPDDVHSPFFPPKVRRGNESKRERYLGVLKTMSDQLGVLFARIRDDKALRDNTLIVVCSDNGPEDGAGSAGPFRGHKGNLYEGGIRSPLIVWGPGFIAKSEVGTTNKSSVLAAIDLAPSLLAIANVAPAPECEFDGVPMQNVLLGKSDASRDKPLFLRRPPDRPGQASEANLPDLAVREGTWKLLCEYNGTKPQLYNIETDTSESSNVAASNPEVVRRLTTELVGWHQSMPPDEGATYREANKVRRKRPTDNQSQALK